MSVFVFASQSSGRFSISRCSEVLHESFPHMENSAVLAPAELIRIIHPFGRVFVLVVQAVLITRRDVVYRNLIVVRQRASISKPRCISHTCRDGREPLCEMVCETRLSVVGLGVTARYQLVGPSLGRRFLPLSPQACVDTEFWIGQVKS